MGDIPVLFVDGALKGQIRKLADPGAVLVNVEPVSGYDELSDWLRPWQQLYRSKKFVFFNRMMCLGWCGPESEPSITALVDTLLSDAAKQLYDLTPPELHT